MRTNGARYGIELDTLSYTLHHIVGKVRHKTNTCGFDINTMKRTSKCTWIIFECFHVNTCEIAKDIQVFLRVDYVTNTIFGKVFHSL